jgi:hypothetical protein
MIRPEAFGRFFMPEISPSGRGFCLFSSVCERAFIELNACD